VDLVEIMCEENAMKCDNAGFEEAFKEAQEKSRAAGKKGGGRALLFEAEATAWLANNDVPLTDDSHKYAPGDAHADATVKAILTLDGFVGSTESVEGPIGLVLDKTSFYAESGGQVCDVGVVECVAGSSMTVEDTKAAAGFVLHVGAAIDGVIAVGDAVRTAVDHDRRNNIMPNHTMTHVLNHALRQVLGDSVDQKGSLVDDEKLRFDFSHSKAMSADQIKKVEALVRDQVNAALSVHTREVALDKAKAISGLRAVFGEVYPDPVRVVSVGPSIDDLLATPDAEDWKGYSIEFCGGTHLANTSDATDFVLLSEEGIAKGVRRIVGATKGAAAAALETARTIKAQVNACDALDGADLEKAMAGLKGTVDTSVMPAVQRAEIRDAMAKHTKRIAAAIKEAAAAAKANAIEAVGEKTTEAKAAGASAFVAQLGDFTDPAALKDAAAVAFKQGVACALFSKDPVKGKAMCYVSVPTDVAVDVKGWLDACCGPIGGKGGGGKGGVAQGQGPDVDGLPAAVDAAKAFAGL
jgi:alanyl-tRNA synthetase